MGLGSIIRLFITILFTDTQTFTEPVPLKYGKLAIILGCIMYGYFLYCVYIQNEPFPRYANSTRQLLEHKLA